MNKTAIKNFSIWARNKLIADVSYKAGLMGITASGISKPLPQSTGSTEFYDIGTKDPYAINGEAVRQRRQLVELLERKAKESNYSTAYKYVLEEVAYTWFNRLIAIRFMEVNDYLPAHVRVLSSDSGKMEPDLVTSPFNAELVFSETEKDVIRQMKLDNAIDELFQMLFVKQCNALNAILPGLFEKTSDYTELLLSVSVIDQDGVVYHLVHDIPEEDFDVNRGGQVEIIGWLYQYYNTEPKNEAFAKTGKITKDEIPAVTQLFTPDWIVRYMVENSLGRIFIDKRKNEGIYADGRDPAEMTWDEIEEKRIANEESIAQDMGWRYYLPEAKQEPEVAAQLEKLQEEYAHLAPQDIKVIDPCMGSGHILVYAFDVLMQIYENAGWTQRDAAKSILENNLYGLDIDDRAYQLAYFAVMMKARQYNRRILSNGVLCNVHAIQESNLIPRGSLKYFGNSLAEIERNSSISQLLYLLDTFKDAKEYGSILSVNQCDWELLERFVSLIDYEGQIDIDAGNLDDIRQQLMSIVRIAKVLACKYESVITNPPYMAISSADGKLYDFVNENYPEEKVDLYSVFVEKCMRMVRNNMFRGMITQHGWMFLGSFEKARRKILKSDMICAAHLGPRGFDEISGEVVQTVAFVSRKHYSEGYRATYDRLIEPTSEKAKEDLFFAGTSRFFSSNTRYESIPGSPIAYWVSQTLIDAFSDKLLGDYAFTKQGFATGNNEIFLRLWYEVEKGKSALRLLSREDAMKSSLRWFPCNKGGTYRKWYGNNFYLANWENNGAAMSSFKGSVIRNPQFYFTEGITWSSLANQLSLRYSPAGFVFESKGSMCYSKGTIDIRYLLGLLNSKVSSEALSILSPTLDFHEGPMARVPVIYSKPNLQVVDMVKTCIELSKSDWDSFETSWDYEWHPLVKKGLSRSHWNADDVTIEECFRAWADECDSRFSKLKTNEEELNRIFIEIYGLQEELTPEVEDNDVTVHRADLQRDIKSLLSYAVGCMFGRYSLGSAGLAYAGGEWDVQKYSQFKPDIDNIIPITDEEYLDDDIISRLCEFLKIAFGERTLEQNLDYIAAALGGKGNSSREIIRNYFLNSFFDDHCQTYSVTGSGKRPIYWLFDSGKQNGFKALVYLHRYNADTIGNLRVDYLHKMQRVYESEIGRMQDTIDHSSNAREVAAATKRKEKLQKQLKECREYDEKIGHLALSRIELDLDDGVKVNYRKLQTAQDGKFYEVLAKSKDIMAKEK